MINRTNSRRGCEHFLRTHITGYAVSVLRTLANQAANIDRSNEQDWAIDVIADILIYISHQHEHKEALFCPSGMLTKEKLDKLRAKLQLIIKNILRELEYSSSDDEVKKVLNEYDKLTKDALFKTISLRYKTIMQSSSIKSNDGQYNERHLTYILKRITDQIANRTKQYIDQDIAEDINEEDPKAKKHLALETIPQAVLKHILRYLELKNIDKLSRVSKRYANISMTHILSIVNNMMNTPDMRVEINEQLATKFISSDKSSFPPFYIEFVRDIFSKKSIKKLTEELSILSNGSVKDILKIGNNSDIDIFKWIDSLYIIMQQLNLTSLINIVWNNYLYYNPQILTKSAINSDPDTIENYRRKLIDFATTYFNIKDGIFSGQDEIKAAIEPRLERFNITYLGIKQEIEPRLEKFNPTYSNIKRISERLSAISYCISGYGYVGIPFNMVLDTFRQKSIYIDGITALTIRALTIKYNHHNHLSNKMDAFFNTVTILTKDWWNKNYKGEDKEYKNKYYDAMEEILKITNDEKPNAIYSNYELIDLLKIGDSNSVGEYGLICLQDLLSFIILCSFSNIDDVTYDQLEDILKQAQAILDTKSHPLWYLFLCYLMLRGCSIDAVTLINDNANLAKLNNLDMYFTAIYRMDGNVFTKENPYKINSFTNQQESNKELNNVLIKIIRSAVTNPISAEQFEIGRFSDIWFNNRLLDLHITVPVKEKSID